jgi:hypothetical protein
MPVENKINKTISLSSYTQNYYQDNNPSPPMLTGSDFYPTPDGNLMRTNMVITRNRSLVMLTASDITYGGHITKWNDNPSNLWNFAKSAEHFNIKTKDIDFESPSTRKKIYKVYVTFKAGGYMSGVIMKYAIDGSSTFSNFADTTYYSNAKGFDSYNSGSGTTSDWITVGLKPSSSISNAYSMQLQFSFGNQGRVNACQSSSGSTNLTLDLGASGTANHYVGMPIYLFSDITNSDVLKVTAYNNSSKACTVSPAWTDSTIISNNTLFDVGFIPKEFAINDISVVYREKPIK